MTQIRVALSCFCTYVMEIIYIIISNGEKLRKPCAATPAYMIPVYFKYLYLIADLYSA